ncbi:glycosyltransferase [Bacillus sp. FJAT-52991]|uniref:Glycosyltransferase n=1 Tax=Bacillus kandeliae TaxID=3129297 RepID=A0ABZ2N4Q6_9BACI
MNTLLEWARTVVDFLSQMIFFYTVAIILIMLLLFVLAIKQIRKTHLLDFEEPYDEHLRSEFTKPISILVPGKNEETGIVNTVRSLLTIDYPEFEIIVINDGSTDSTLQTMIEAFELKPITSYYRKRLDSKPIRQVYQSKVYPHLFLMDKESGGKADALNAGMNLAQYPFFCSLDADSIIERTAFVKIMKPIIDSGDEIIASGGSVRIANDCVIERGELKKVALSKNRIVVHQVIEYLRDFLFGRIGFGSRNLLLIVSGAFGVFSKEYCINIGGYRTNTVGEDMDLVVRLHRYIKKNKLNKKIAYIPEPVCWTEAPETLSILRKQRNRWYRGLFESLWHNKRMFLNPRYGKIGLISLPYYFFIELLGPLIEMIGYFIILLGPFLGGIYIQYSLALFCCILLLGSMLSMFSILLEEWSFRRYEKIGDFVRLFISSLLESFWYRPLMTFFRVEGFFQIIFRKKSWGDMKRKGVSQS